MYSRSTSILTIIYKQLYLIFLTCPPSDSYARSKSYCEDITEGKFSFPIIHAVRAQPSDTRLLNVLRMHTEDADVKRCAVRWLEQCGSMAYTRDALRGLVDRVLQAIEDLGGHEALSALVRTLDAELDLIQAPALSSSSSVPSSVPSSLPTHSHSSATPIVNNAHTQGQA